MNILIIILKSFRSHLRHILIGHLSFEHQHIEQLLEENKIGLGRINSSLIKDKNLDNIQLAEFKVFSQFGEDGIIQYLVNKVHIERKVFVELGVGDYTEANTRFLLVNNNWQGVIVDMDDSHRQYLVNGKGKNLYYAHDIQVVTQKIEPLNINSILKKAGIHGDIGLLSIDLDGIDYWVLKEIKEISPRIIVTEYSSTFGKRFPVTIPYKKNFYRLDAHYSGLYFGASLRALYDLCKQRGYRFVGSNSAGNNAFFVREDVALKLKSLTVDAGYVKSTFRESKDPQGELTYISNHSDRLNVIKNLKVINTSTNKLIYCSQLQ